MKTIAIAGTAGRKEDAARLNAVIYRECEDVLRLLLPEITRTEDEIYHLVSGGAAWADHLAVRYFLASRDSSLTLHLPCAFENGKFVDNGSRDWRMNPGNICNYFHRKFSESTGIDSLGELADVIATEGCTVTVSKGFHARNSLMAKSDALVAFTFGEGATVKDGGTADTCKSYLSNVARSDREDLSFHVDLSSTPLVVHSGIRLPKAKQEAAQRSLAL